MNILRLFQQTTPEAPSAATGAERERASQSQADHAAPSAPPLNAMSREEMIGACKRMAVKELALAGSADTRSLRVDHVYNAASWSERAELLQRIENSANKRDALDAAERDRAGASDRLIARDQGMPNARN